MCKLSNMYVVDLFNNTTTGGIEWNVANTTPKLMNNPCKIVVKQIQSELKDNAGGNISALVNLRVVHNINIQSGTNYAGFSNSNTLAFIDSFQARSTDDSLVSTIVIGVTTTTPAVNITGFTSCENILYAPNGLPAILTLNRYGGTNATPPVDDKRDNVNLSWSVRLEITVNPDQDEE